MDIVERFINYTKINTTTSRENGAKGIMPSSPGQMKLAKLLVSELEALGMEDIILRENAIVTATLPANTDETIPVVSFLDIWTPVPNRQPIQKRNDYLITGAISV